MNHNYIRQRDALKKKDPAQVIKATRRSTPQPEPMVIAEPDSEDDPVPFYIEQVAMDYVPARADRPPKRVDLRPHEASLRRLFADCEEVYLVALDDWKSKADPDKPKRRLEDNCAPDDPEPPYEYGEDTGDGFKESWEEWWLEHYYRKRGNPGRGRTKDLPVEPLHAVYALVRRWWLQNIDSSGFRPDYPRDDDKGSPRKEFTNFNPAGRLLLLIAQDIDPGYTSDICANLYDTAKIRRRRARSK